MERNCWREVLVLMDQSLLPKGSGWNSVSRMGEVGHNLSSSPQGPRGVQVLERWQIAADHLLMIRCSLLLLQWQQSTRW